MTSIGVSINYTYLLRPFLILDLRLNLYLIGTDEAMVQIGEVLTTLESLYDDYKLQSSTSPIADPPPLQVVNFPIIFFFMT